MVGSSLCNYNDAYILVKRSIIITGVGADAAARQADEINKQVPFKIFTLFTNCINEINHT